MQATISKRLPPKYPTPIEKRLAWLNAMLSHDKLTIGNDGKIWAVGQYKNKEASYGRLVELGRDICDRYLAIFPIPIHYASGDGIHEVFENYRPGSCMRYAECREIREIYAQNPDRVGCAYWIKGEHPALSDSGSCLVWHGNNAYIDRIYGGFSLGAKQSIILQIDKYCRKTFNVGETKSLHSSSHDNGLVRAKSVKFHLDCEGLDYLPYIDCLYYCTNHGDGTITLSTSNGDFTAQRTMGDHSTLIDGGDDNDDRAQCCHCGEHCDDDDLHYVDNDGMYCEHCLSNNFDYCEYSDRYVGSGETTHCTILDRRNSIREITIADSELSDDFHPYSGELYDCEYIYASNATEIDGVGYVHDDEIGSIDDKNLDSDSWVEPYFSDSVVSVSDCVWNEQLSSWQLASDDASEFASILASNFNDTDKNCNPVLRIGDVLQISWNDDKEFYLEHIGTETKLPNSTFSNWQAMVDFAAMLVVRMQWEYTSLWERLRDTTIDNCHAENGPWSILQATQLREAMQSYRLQFDGRNTNV